MTAPNIPPLRASWTGYLRGRLLHLLGRIRNTEVPPSPTEAREADRTLHLMLRPAVFGELGGFRPKTTNRHSSWWGGCALAAPGEEVPLGRSGKPMQALLQIRTDEVEMSIPGLENTELLTLWLDLEGNLSEAVEGIDFKVSTYTRMDGLVPLGPGYRESDALVTFPVRWQTPVPQQPSWEDFAAEIPDRVAWSDTSAWFYDNPSSKRAFELQSAYPVKIGGWPTWIQGSQWDRAQHNEDFVLQIDSTAKGRIGFGDSGSIYLFRSKASAAWHLRCDFY
ncbi:DUF1963 domain-containing protein [Leisingera sp. ANG-M1]|uniref:DUF1963 domain-containing protein n=1 Tax=Leisingera sp. ANG-M1 TaxID=1577895 RepID=UPI0009E5E814|nr:DUF1963 domain-containing protein [Leisingera sp. ANG-M1]